MNTYIYGNNAFAEISSYVFSCDNTEILNIKVYHYDTMILNAHIGNTDNEPSACFTACGDVGRFSHSDMAILSLVITRAIDIAKYTKENVKALKEVLHLINRNTFDKWYSDYDASNGVTLSVSVNNVNKLVNSRIHKNCYLAVRDNR